MRKLQIFLVLILGVALFAQTPGNTEAADFTATVNIDTGTAYGLQEGLLGYNLHITNRAYDFTDPDFVDMAIDLNGKWGRWFAGTANVPFNTTTGQMTEERDVQLYGNGKLYYKYQDEMRMIEGKNDKRDNLIDYYEFLRKTGSKLTIVVNAFTGTPEEAADLVQFCKDNDIIVEYWELNNEPYLFLDGSVFPKFFKSATDYLNKLKPFRDAIKSVDPGAKTAVAYSTTGNKTWDQKILDYTAGSAVPYWDAIVWHTYEATDTYKANGTTFEEAMENGNWLLPRYRSRIDANYLANSELNPTPIIQNELDVKVAGPLYNTQYNAVFNAEAVMRLTTVPQENLAMLTGSGGIATWVLDAAVDYSDRVLDEYERDQTLNTAGVDHELFYKTPGLSNKIINQAINNSTARWDTSVSGGTTVETMDDHPVSPVRSTMPALYAMAYKGDYNNNNKNYVLITNKSDKSHDVTIQMDGTNVSAAMTKTYITSSDPQAKNTAENPNTVAIQSASTSNPVFVPPYSVVRVEWNRGDSLAAPVSTRIARTDVGNQKVTLGWWPIEGATGYRIQYGTAPGQYTSTLNVGNVTTYEVTGLDGNTDYYFTVQAGNQAGYSAVSNEVKATVAAPDTPVMTKAFGERDKMLQVEWKSVPNASGYKVKYGTASGTYTHTVDVGNTIGYVLEKLNPGTVYYVAVSAYNGMGESGNSTEWTGKPKMNLAYTPHELRKTGGSATSVILAWEPSPVRLFKDWFEDGVATDSWTETKGTWDVVDHPGSLRNTKVYKVESTGGLAQAHAGDSNWTDYSAVANVEVETWNANGTVSILGRYTSDQDYYRFVYNNSDSRFKLIKDVNGTFTTLAQVDLADVLADRTFNPLDIHNMKLILRFDGNRIRCYVDDVEIIDVTDSSHASGEIAIASNKQQALFDKIYVFGSNMSGGTYNLYRSEQPQSGYTLIASGLTANSHTDTGLTSGHTYYYKVTTVKDGVESVGNSNIFTVNK